jgi:hypothetical protein
MGEHEMADTRLTADRYISRGGGSPKPSSAELAADLMQVSNFILWHEDRDMYGAVRKQEAWLAFCRLVNVEPRKIEAIIRPEPNA